jgi:hypothetical protein
MAERDGAAIEVHLRLVQPELPDAGHAPGWRRPRSARPRQARAA